MNNQNNAAPCPGVDAQGELPFAWYLRTGHGNAIHFGTEPPDCLLSHEWKPVYERPAPTGVYAAGKVDALVKLAKYCADSLEAELNARYAGTLHYSGQKLRYDGDMRDVIDLRAVLAALAEGEKA